MTLRKIDDNNFAVTKEITINIQDVKQRLRQLQDLKANLQTQIDDLNVQIQKVRDRIDEAKLIGVEGVE